MRLVAQTVALAVAALLVACGGSPAPEARTTGTPAAGAGSAAQGPTASITEPRPRVHPGVLVAEPGEGSCGEPIRLTASGFEGGSPVEFLAWRSLDTAELLGAAPATSAGEAVFEVLPDALAASCYPGAEYLFEARISGDSPSTAWPRAIHAIQQVGRFWIEQTNDSCSGPIDAIVRGEGLPALTRLRFVLGDAGPFAHNFVELGTAVTADDGTLALAASLPLSCDQRAMAIYAHDAAGELRARWKAPLSTAGN